MTLPQWGGVKFRGNPHPRGEIFLGETSPGGWGGRGGGGIFRGGFHGYPSSSYIHICVLLFLQNNSLPYNT